MSINIDLDLLLKSLGVWDRIVNMKYIATDKIAHEITVPAGKRWYIVALRVYMLRTEAQEGLIQTFFKDETGEQFWCVYSQLLTGTVNGVLAQTQLLTRGAMASTEGLGAGGTYTSCTDYGGLPDPPILNAGAKINISDSKGNAQYVKYWLRVLEADV